MSALQSFLVDRINALDMDGSLVKSILKVRYDFAFYLAVAKPFFSSWIVLQHWTKRC